MAKNAHARQIGFSPEMLIGAEERIGQVPSHPLPAGPTSAIFIKVFRARLHPRPPPELPRASTLVGYLLVVAYRHDDLHSS